MQEDKGDIMSDLILPQESKTITPEELNGKMNVIFAVLSHPETKEMQIVINSSNEFILATALRRMDRSIDGHLYEVQVKRQSTAIQTAPASVLERLNEL